MKNILFSAIATLSIALCTLLAPKHGAAHSGLPHFQVTPSDAVARTQKIAPMASLDMGAQIESALIEVLDVLPPPPRKSKLATLANPNVRLLNSTLKKSIMRNEIVINLNHDVMAYGLGSAEFEQILHTLQQRAYDAVHERLENIVFVVQIEGVPLSQYFAFEKVLREATLDTNNQATSFTQQKSVAGRRVAVSPGHGYWFGTGRWQLQRSFLFGIVEDFANSEFVIELDSILRASGAQTRPTRELNKLVANGESGFPRWQQAARYHVREKGAPESVWNSLTSSTTDDLDDDIRVRPLYANWRDANGINSEILVSLHNNGGGGTGTETLYDTDNGFGPESKRLADAVHNKIIAAIRSQFNPNWPDRRVKGFAGSYGENRLATRPSILIEVAFMDTKSPDNDAIQDARFRRIVNEAIAQGVAEFFANQVDTTPPTVPNGVVSAAASATQIDLKWSASTDNVGVAGYRVSRNGAEIAITSSTSLTDTGLSAGTRYQYTVAARDIKGNWSAESPLASVSTFPPTPYLGLWWAGEAESGWGMSVTQHNGIIFVAIFTYDANGQPTWYVMSNCTVTGNSCSGKLYSVTGGKPPTAVWTAGGLNVVEVGDASLVFSDANNGVFNALINNVAARKIITRQDVRSGTVPNIIDFTDLWWNAAESGWGISLTHANSNIFATWFAYDATGKAIWYVAPSCTLLAATMTTSCSSELFSVTGGFALTTPWIAGRTTVKREGSFTLQFTDASNAIMTYTLGGNTLTRQITRQPF
jgi:N-acetylmuramoyl-L-alanine amidase